MAYIPSVFIGIGGVGKSILLRMRRMIIENYKSLDNLPSIRFLHVDTHRNPNPDGGTSILLEVLGQDIRFRDAERVDLSENIGRQIDQAKEAVRANVHVMEWFDDSLSLDHTFADGAGGIRPYGRLAFHYGVHTFRRKLTDTMAMAVRDANRQKTGQTLGMGTDPNQQNIYVVSSLFGGTGSGTFLEVCYNARAALIPQGIHPYVVGTFVISGNVDDIRQANCYSALKELEYYSTGAQTRTAAPFTAVYPVPGASSISSQERPCDVCYLVSHLGDRGTIFDRNKLEETVAFNLFLEFASPISEEKRGTQNDIFALEEFRNLDSTLGRTKQFLTFGLSVLEFPAPRLQEMLAHELAANVIKGWLFESAQGTANLEREVEDFLKANKLDERDLINNLLTAGNQSLLNTATKNLSNQQDKVRSLIDINAFDREIITTTIEEHRRENIHSTNFSDDPRECGSHTATIQRNAEKLMMEFLRSLDDKVNSIVENEHRGPKDAIAFLNAILRFCIGKSKAFSKAFQDYENRCAREDKDIFDGLQRFKGEMYPTFYRNETKHWNQKIHSELMKTYLTSSLKREAYRAANEMLSHDTTRDGEFIPCGISRIEGLLTNLQEYTTGLRTLAEGFEEKQRQIEHTLTGTPLAEGLSLTPARLREISAYIVPRPSVHIVRMLGRVKDALGTKDNEGNVVKQEYILRAVNQRREDLRTILIREASEICAGVRKISIADELRKVANLPRVLEQAYQQAGTMLRIAGLRPGSDEGMKTEWVATANRQQDRNLEELLQEINNVHAYGGQHSRHLEDLPEPYQIIFAEERGVFPLRAISHLKDYQKAYKSRRPRSTHKQIDFPDLFPEDPKITGIQDRAERAALFGRLLGWLVREHDPQTEYDVIYLSYYDATNRTDRHVKLCTDWEDVADRLSQEQIQKEIERVVLGVTSLEILEGLIREKMEATQTKTARERVWQDLQAHLNELEGSLRGGTRHPEYQRQLIIIEQFRKEYALQPPDSPPEEPPVKPPPLTGKDDKREQAFQKYVLERLGRTSHESLLKYGTRLMRLRREVAARIIEEASLQSPVPLDAGLEEYKKAFEHIIVDGVIDEHKRQTLLQKQQALGLADEEIRAIEHHFTTAQYRELFQMAVEDGLVSSDERERLGELQMLLHLSDEQVQEIESDFVFEEE